MNTAPLIGSSLTKTDLLKLQFHPDLAYIYVDDAVLSAPEVEKYATEETSNSLGIAAWVFTPLQGEQSFPNALYAPIMRGK